MDALPTRALFAPEFIPLDGADARLHRQCFDAVAADDLLRRLHLETDWRQEHLHMFGRDIAVPRLVAWHGDVGYRYSGIDHPPRPWTPLLTSIKTRAEAVAGTVFNGVLLNLYRDGRDCMGWHSDDEAELGSRPIIASVSLGAARRFQFRRRDDYRNRHEVVLEAASILVMAGDTQARWQHRLPRSGARTATDHGPRINLTFRFMVASDKRTPVLSGTRYDAGKNGDVMCLGAPRDE